MTIEFELYLVIEGNDYKFYYNAAGNMKSF